MPPAVEADLEQEIDRLYGLPLDEFIEARNELSARARAGGQRAIAARVKELRKPTVSAWVVNQLARENELDVRRLLKAGERLAQTQRDAVAGHDPSAFAEARKDEQHALTRLASDALKLLRQEGHGAGAVERITQTLRAAAVTEEGRRLLEQGRLTEDLEPQGFEAFAGIAVPARKGSPRGRTDTGKHLRELRERARARSREAEAAEAEADRVERQAMELREAAAQARAEADAAAEAISDYEGRSE